MSVGGVYGGKPYDCGFSVKLDSNKSASVRMNRFAQLNKWYHIAGVYDGRTVKYYVNGEEAGSFDVPAGLKNKPLKESGATDLVIGRSAVNRKWSDTHINGMIDEVMLFNRALTQPAIKQIYNSQKK